MAVLSVLILIFTHFMSLIHASYHCVVTENGKIQSQEKSSGFPLRRPDDLVLLLDQEERINTIARMYKELLFFKRSVDEQWNKIEEEGDIKERLYTTDNDCLLGVKPLTQHDLTTEFVDYEYGSRPKMKDVPKTVPDCTIYSKLDFSMMTFPHLDTLNRRDNLTVNPLHSKASINFDIDAMLKENNSDWTAYNVASLYWRIMGNGTNALECSRRAIYFSPRDKRHIVLLNLGTLLQELHSLGEAAIVLHSAVDHDPLQYISHMALGNVYAILGDYARSLACYENVLNLNPENERAAQLKHAVHCQEKLESGLIEMHSLLQNILQDLQKYYETRQNLQLLHYQVNTGKDRLARNSYSDSHPIHLDLGVLLSNVEKQAKSLMADMTKIVRHKKNTCQSDKSDCPSQRKIDEDYEDEDDDKEVAIWTREEETRNSWLEDDTEYSLRKNMISLGEKMSSYEDSEAEIYHADLRRAIRHQINFMQNLKDKSRFTADQANSFRLLEDCVESETDAKSMWDCFIRVFDTASLKVKERIAKLNEKIKLIGQEESKGNSLPDESSLENYIEVKPKFVFESESCQRLRDTTEF